jgi:pimeloyl-ACP methyl ester carboxylesterase
VLLSIPGPPGGSDIGAMRTYLSGLEEHFVVATWVRRGGAKSYGAIDPASTFTMDSEVSDALGVTDYLRGRFHQSRIVLVGHSGGSLLGVLAAQRQPSWFRAYVGVGQAVDVAESDVLQYRDTLAWARRTGNDALAKRLAELGPPPYDHFLSYEPMQANESSVYPYDRGHAADATAGAGVPEYTLLEKVHYFAGTFDAFDILYPRYQDVDLRARVRRLEVPVWFVMGAHEVPGRLQAVQQWYGQLHAPDKELVMFDRSGHRPQFEQPDRFVEVMQRVLAGTPG